MTPAARLGRASAILFLAMLSACGYALVGRGTVVDPTIKKIAVPLFKDSTGKPGLDQKVTQKVVEELLKRGRFDVTSERIGADAVLEGEILRYDQTPVGFSDAGGSRTQASRYSVTLTARVRYVKVGVEEPIWANESFSFRDEYDVGSDPTAFFDQSGQAIERLSTSFARSLVAAMLEAF
ncbi:MAG TPA: LptE family protein [Vicinamibacteria bacterium]|nr:LptE family protein [Vicinamibacteria bacterium]